MSEAELAKIPYLEAGFLRDYDLWRKVPYTIIFKTKKTIKPTQDQSRSELSETSDKELIHPLSD
jgi:hypothetical protein